MERTLVDVILLAGATAWWSTALVLKDGPGQLFLKFRFLMQKLLGPKQTPLTCVFCTGFWVGLLLLSAFASGDELLRAVIQFFGVLGIAAAFRGQSAEF